MINGWSSEFRRSLDRSVLLDIHNVRILGSGDPIVFVHGFGSDQSVWRHQVRSFADTNQLILFDHIGAVPRTFDLFDARRYRSMYAYAADLLEIITALNLSRCTVVAHSMSGLAALLASIGHSDLVSKVIAIGSSACYRNDGAYKGGFNDADLAEIYSAMQTNYAAWAEQFAVSVTESDQRTQDAEDFARTLKGLRPDIAHAVLKLAFECDHRKDLQNIRTSAHIIQSGHDVAVPLSAAAYLASEIPGATLSVLDTTRGHLPHLTAPSLLNSLLLRHLY